MRKKAALSLDNRYNTMIENAFYYSNPPNNQNIVREVRPPKHEYIRKLLYKDLNKVSTEKVNICDHQFYCLTFYLIYVIYIIIYQKLDRLQKCNLHSSSNYIKRSPSATSRPTGYIQYSLIYIKLYCLCSGKSILRGFL